MDYLCRVARRVGVALLVLGATAAAGCGDDTGLLVEVTRDPVSTPADIETLEIVIGVSQADAQGRYIKDASSTSDVAMNGRDLATSPYGGSNEGNGADELGGAIFMPQGTGSPRGMVFVATLSNGKKIAGVFTNRLGSGWSPVDGFGVINAEKAVNSAR